MSTINILLGFEPIFFDHFLISEEMKRRGQLLFERGKIENVTETRGPGLSRLSEIRASCNNRINKAPYSIILDLNEDRKVTRVLCSCDYGVDGQCIHVYATMLHINYSRMQNFWA